MAFCRQEKVVCLSWECRGECLYRTWKPLVRRSARGPWRAQSSSSLLRPWSSNEGRKSLREAATPSHGRTIGLGRLETLGNSPISFPLPSFEVSLPSSFVFQLSTPSQFFSGFSSADFRTSSLCASRLNELEKSSSFWTFEASERPPSCPHHHFHLHYSSCWYQFTWSSLIPFASKEMNQDSG